MEEMSNDHRKTLLSDTSLKNTLRAKSRHRREQLTGLAAASSAAAHPLRNDVLPKLELVELAPGDLVLLTRKLRKNEAAHIGGVATAISSLGFCDPVLIDQHNGVLDGMIRVEAAKLLGLPYVPCIRANYLTASEGRLVRLALNRLGEKGSWDFDELKIELEELILDSAPIEITGFSMLEVDQIVIGEEPAAVETGPLTPDPDATPVAQRGDVFAGGEHRIICGDATDPRVLEILMAGDQARLLLTDEPYNCPIAGHVTSGVHREFKMASGEMSDAQFGAFNADWMGASLTHLCDGGLFGTFIDWRGYPAVIAAAQELGLTTINLIVWGKSNGGMGSPVTMLEDALLDMSNRGDIVLDPFLGSGSTLIAAERAGRRCRGVELDPLYVDVILHRYELVTGRPAVLEGTGETYAELALRRQADAQDRAVPQSPSENAHQLQLAGK